MNDQNPDVVVVGAGAFGAWTALELVERGGRITLVDAYGAGNPMGSSGGESRNIRAAYGAQEIYTSWAMRAWDLWLAREGEFGLRCLYPSGSLRVLPAGDIEQQVSIFDRLSNPYEVLTSEEVGARWPHIAFDETDPILFEPKSGTLAARDALIAIVARFEALGGTYRRARVALPQTASGRLGYIEAEGETLSAASFVFACGPWLPRLFPDLLGNYIKTPRRELFFLAPQPGDRRFDWDRCPSLADPLGWTSSDIGSGVKFAPVIRHVPMDPDAGDRMPSAELLGQVRAYATARLPALATAPVVSTYVSQLENTDNEHFIIDRHPQFGDVIIAGGGSGHAYKMGPVIGEHIAQFVISGAQPADLAAMFSLAAHRPVAPHQGG